MNVKFVNGAMDAIVAHKARTGLDGDQETQVWQLLASIREFCRHHRIDIDSLWESVKEEEPNFAEAVV